MISIRNKMDLNDINILKKQKKKKQKIRYDYKMTQKWDLPVKLHNTGQPTEFN